METQNHIRIAGTLFIVWGSLGLIISVIALYFCIDDTSRILAIAMENNPTRNLLLYIWAAVLILLFLSLSYIFVGRAIRADKVWATRIVGFILAIISLPSIPVGTVIGLYTIWALNKKIKDEPVKIKTVS